MSRVLALAVVILLVMQVSYIASRMRAASAVVPLPPLAHQLPPTRHHEPPQHGGNGEGPVMPIASQPWPEVLATLRRLPAGSLTPAQRSAMAPVLKSMAALASDPRVRPGVTLVAARHVLRSDQIRYLLAHRHEPAPPPPAGAMGATSDETLLGILRRRADEPAGPPRADGAVTEDAGSLAVEDLIRGLVRLDADPAVALTPWQARVLLRPIALACGNKRQLEAAKQRLLAMLTPAQLSEMAAVHREVMGETAEEISPLEVLAPR